MNDPFGRLIFLLAALLITRPDLPSQTIYAPGCAGVNPAPTVTYTGSLTPGGDGGIHLYGAPPNATCVIALGTTNTDPDGTLLELSLAHIAGVAQGCTLNVQPLITIQFATDNTGEVHLYFQVPDYLGSKLCFQFAVIDSPSPLSIAISEALQLDLKSTVDLSSDAVGFAAQFENETSPPQIVSLTNNSENSQQINDVQLVGEEASDFAAIIVSGSLPLVLAPGAAKDVEITFTPGAPGIRNAELKIIHDALIPLATDPVVQLSGVGLGEKGSEILLNAGASDIYMDSTFQMWAADYQYVGGAVSATGHSVSGTADEELYKSYRTGPGFAYELDVPDGVYEVTLHFADFAPSPSGPRLMDISAEGTLILDNLNILERVGPDAALQETFVISVADGVLDLEFSPVSGPCVVSGIEARLQFAALEITPTQTHDFAFVDQGTASTLNLTAMNAGTVALEASSIDFLVNSGAGHDFLLDMSGQIYTGSEQSINLPATLTLPPGTNAPLDVSFQPTEHGANNVDLIINGNFSSQAINLQGTGGVGGHPFLHAVIEPIGTAVDYDGDGIESIDLDGSFSHTHEPGHTLSQFTWDDGSTTIAVGALATADLAIGDHSICLTIEDDNNPPEMLTSCSSVKVVTPMSVPGVNAQYYDTNPMAPETLLDGLPLAPGWVEVVDLFRVEPNPNVGTSPFTSNVLARLTANVEIAAAGAYTFEATGGVESRLYVNGTPYTDAVPLIAGTTFVEARFAIHTLGELPIEVLMALEGNPPTPIEEHTLTHSEVGTLPFINSMPDSGGTAGGNMITISGTGFFPASDLIVHWGSEDLDLANFSNTDNNSITFTTPLHSAGVISVSVETPTGLSNAHLYEYTDTAPPPIVFDFRDLAGFWPNKPTCGDWGPDGRLYFGNRSGILAAITVDENYNQTSELLYSGVSNLTNPEILGLAISPFDGTDPVTIYVAHAELYAQGGTTPTQAVPYNGQISKLTGPDFDTPIPVITGLPVSNHDHGINGMAFDNNGDLLIAVGGTTNAGIQAPVFGDLPESPLTGAILKAELSNPAFNGQITYVDSLTGLPDADQRHGEGVDIAPGSHVTVHAPGLRNTFDLAITTRGYLYATDNGANSGLGNGSTGPSSDNDTAESADEIILIEQGLYYGHPNRNRGRYDAREYTYHDDTEPSLPGVFRQKLGGISSSINGIAEYRATTFGGQMQGDLLVQRWKGYLRRVSLSDDGRSITNIENLEPRTDSLGVMTGPGGAIIGIKYQGQRVDVLVPEDAGAVGVTAYDILPWRALATGGADFVIGGENFGTLAETTVTIGGTPAPLTAVTSRRIYGTIPAAISPTTDMLPVVVTSGPEQSIIPNAFRYLFVPAGNEPGRWLPGAEQMDVALGAVSGGEIDGVLYVVGQNSDLIHTYDVNSNSWSSIPGSTRPFVGHNHAAEVHDGQLYLFGGEGGGSEGAVQIYNPVTNIWSTGAPMPWNGASCSTALINGLIYAAGGIVDSLFTTDKLSTYDPGSDTWSTLLTPMPSARNHAAAGTDGHKLYLFGGRGPGSGDTGALANGFANIQIYDPLTDTWQSSNDVGSSLTPLPAGRGGAGKSIFKHGEFYVFGGETLDAPGATPQGVYDRVDVYNPATNIWRLEAPMPTARHGVFPILFESRVFLFAGATTSGLGQSSSLEIFTRQ
jgi:N-acetylneuraminic acid mutarotase/glucose/arabinose dehydrogenase